MAGWKSVGLALSGLAFAFSAWGQSSTDQSPAPDQAQEHKQEPGAAREIGAGAATAGTGAAKGAGMWQKEPPKELAMLSRSTPLMRQAQWAKGL
jgi:hypothetical protein